MRILYPLSQGGLGSVQLRYVHVAVQAVPVFGSDGSSLLWKRFFFFLSQCCLLTERDGSGFGSWKSSSDGSGSSFGFWKTVLTVLVSGSGSVPEPSCLSAPLRPLLGYSDAKSSQVRRCLMLS